MYCMYFFMKDTIDHMKQTWEEIETETQAMEASMEFETWNALDESYDPQANLDSNEGGRKSKAPNNLQS